MIAVTLRTQAQRQEEASAPSVLSKPAKAGHRNEGWLSEGLLGAKHKSVFSVLWVRNTRACSTCAGCEPPEHAQRALGAKHQSVLSVLWVRNTRACSPCSGCETPDNPGFICISGPSRAKSWLVDATLRSQAQRCKNVQLALAARGLVVLCRDCGFSADTSSAPRVGKCTVCSLKARQRQAP